MTTWGERTSSLLDLEAGSSLTDLPASSSRSPGAAGGSTVLAGNGLGMSSSFDAAGPGPVLGSSADSPVGVGSLGGSLGYGLGLLRVPRSPSFPQAYGSGRSYNIRIGEEQQVLAKFTPRTSQPIYYLGDAVSGVLSFPPAWQSKKQLKRHWRCLEVSVQLETHESSSTEQIMSSAVPVGMGTDFIEMSASASAAMVASGELHMGGSSGSLSSMGSSAHLSLLAPTPSTSVAVRAEYHEVVLDLLSTSFLFTIPSDAPVSSPPPSKATQWVLHFEFVAFSLPKPSKKGSPSPSGAPQSGRRHSLPGTPLARISEQEDRGSGGGGAPVANPDSVPAADPELEEDEDPYGPGDDDEGILELLVEHQQSPRSTLSRSSGLQAEKAEWSMPITVHAPPVARRSTLACV